jgi:hypothetical protein
MTPPELACTIQHLGQDPVAEVEHSETVQV